MTLKKYLYPLLLILLLNLLAYSNSFHNSFHFDDEAILSHLSEAHQDSYSLSFFQRSLNIYRRALLWRPVSGFTLGLNYHWGERDTFGYHVFNFSMHVITAFVLFLFLYKTLRIESCGKFLRGKAFQISLFGCLLWSLHPIQTQAVTYIVQRMAMLGGLFSVMSVYSYALFRDTKRNIFLICMILLSVAAFGSKEHTLVLPLLIFIYEWLFYQNGDLSFLLKKRTLIGVSLIFLTLFLIGISMEGPHVIGRLFHNFSLDKIPGREFSVSERLLTEQRVVLYYLSLIVYPLLDRFNLNHDFSVSQGWLTPPSTLLSGFVILGLLFFAFKKRSSFPFLSFVIFWYFITLLVESSVFNLEIIFEHRAYLPSMMVFPLITLGIISIEKISKEKRSVYISLGFIFLMIAIFGFSTYKRNVVWKDPVSLWKDCLEKSPDDARCHVNLGSALGNAGQDKEAIELFQKALVLDPENLRAHSNLGVALADAGVLDRAAHHLTEAVRLKSKDPLIYSKLGAVYLKLDDLPNAKKYLRFVIKLNDPNPEIRNNLALIYYYEGKYNAAISLLHDTIQANPQLHRLQFNLGLLYKKVNNMEKSIYWMERAIKRNPSVLDKIHLIDAYYNGSYGGKASRLYKNLLNDLDEKGLSKYDLWVNYIAPLEKKKRNSTYTEPITELDYRLWEETLINENNRIWEYDNK